uniref:Secreted protein n=1 Tax=Macrostomum lignano TaxID=282301 RepID=A0A1I8GJZ0_9PLAT
MHLVLHNHLAVAGSRLHLYTSLVRRGPSLLQQLMVGFVYWPPCCLSRLLCCAYMRRRYSKAAAAATAQKKKKQSQSRPTHFLAMQVTNKEVIMQTIK